MSSRAGTRRLALRRRRAVTTGRVGRGLWRGPSGHTFALLEEFIAIAPVGRALIDAELRYLLINERLAEINGLPVEAHIGHTMAEVLPEIAPTVEAIYRHVLQTGEPVLDVEVQGPTPREPGRQRHFITSYYPMRSIQGVNVVVQEVTAQREAEARLRASEERFRAIADHAGEFIFRYRLGPPLTVEYVSPSATAFTGYSPQEYIDDPELGFRQVHPDDRASMELFRADPSTFRERIELRWVRKEGRVIWVEQSVSVLRDETGRPAIFQGVVRDITERKAAEQAIAEALAAERAARAALQASEARLRGIGERLVAVQEEERRHLARELHDEIGQSLTALNLMLSFAPTLPSEQAATRLRDARAQVAEIIAKVRQRSLDLRPGLLDDLGLLAALEWYVARYTRQTGIKVNFIAATLELRLAPEIELTAYRIVQEGLTNVARHAEVAEVRLRVWVADDRLMLQVEDQGRGMEVDAALAAGTSSGLVGMRERVSLLGGELTLNSEPGQGTLLLADLPLRPRASVRAAG